MLLVTGSYIAYNTTRMEWYIKPCNSCLCQTRQLSLPIIAVPSPFLPFFTILSIFPSFSCFFIYILFFISHIGSLVRNVAAKYSRILWQTCIDL